MMRAYVIDPLLITSINEHFVSFLWKVKLYFFFPLQANESALMTDPIKRCMFSAPVCILLKERWGDYGMDW